MCCKSSTYEKIIFICQWSVENIYRINSKQNQTNFSFNLWFYYWLPITTRSECCCKIYYDYKWTEYCSRLLYQPVFDTNVTTSMWHYVICVNHVIVYRNIQLNYFNIIKLSIISFPLSITENFNEKKWYVNLNNLKIIIIIIIFNYNSSIII